MQSFPLSFVLGLEEQCEAPDEVQISIPKKVSHRPLTNKTIVLDMDLTLICTIGDGSDLSQRMRVSHRSAYEALMKKGVLVPSTLTQFGGSGRAMHNDVVKRPGVDAFLVFCRYVFQHVILWSAGQASYVYDVVRHVLDPNNSRVFDHVYTAQDIVHCTVRPDGHCEKTKGHMSFSTKPIEKLSELFPDVTLKSTVIVDDLPCNFFPNPRNGILIPPFSPQLQQMLADANSGALGNMSDDYYLFKLLHYLADDAFLKIEDVRDYELNFFEGGACRKPS